MTTLELAAPVRLEVDRDLAQRLETACARRAILFAEARAAARPELDVAMAPVAGGVVVYAGPDSPFNQALGLGLRRAVTEKDVDRVEDFFYARRKCPRFEICPLADASLVERLKERGYRLERSWSALVRPITEQDREMAGDPEVVVDRVEPGHEQLWLSTVAEGFSGSETPGPDVRDHLAATLRSPGMIAFLAWIDGEPAGGGGILMYDGIAECCSAGTRPRFRRRGIQTALLAARIAAAARADCDLATAMILPGTTSERNAQRAGFRLAYTKAVLVGQLPDWI
jgi:ribosomal protein S18 acetylase RimI-like enzyme